MVDDRYYPTARHDPPERRTKSEQSAKIANDVAAYLATGATIEVVGSEANAYGPGGRNDAMRRYPPSERKLRDYRNKTTT